MTSEIQTLELRCKASKFTYSKKMKCLVTQKFHHNYNVGIKAQVMNFIVSYQIRIEVTMQLC